MNRTLIRFALFTMVGVLVMLALQWHFSHAWTHYYARFPRQGYEQAMQEGHIPAFLTTSSRSALVGWMVIFALPILSFRFAAGRLISSMLALWVGVMVSLVTIWVATPQLRQDSNMWPIDLVGLGLSTAIPLSLGAMVIALLSKTYGLMVNPAAKCPKPSG